ncbi:ATP-binding protein [Dissulfurispira thermophila]|uniref:ATP-binding protein n=1 Tax=Dissulfurispira thermophila TaxID=2715679 RepID=UPI00193E3A5C|nr:ATP-binding protein [Dissulfurispira thermophila]
MSSFFNYYRIGRFIFALALLISFQIVGLPYAIPRLMFILAIYSFIALLRLVVFTKKMHYFDFLLDIVFISAMVHISFSIYSYLTLLYLFPIFFSSVIIKTKKIFLFPIASVLLYGASYYINGIIAEKESILNIFLHFLSFSLIALAGDNLKQKMQRQEQHIKNLEEEKIKMKGYERLYRVSADLAHELRNPLASISAAVQFLNEGRNSKEFIDMLNTETKRLTSLVNDFLLFSRPSDASKEDVDLPETLKSLVTRVKSQESGVNYSDKKIILNVIDNAKIVANRTFMEIALNNIIKNAIEAAESEVRISLKVKGQDSKIMSWESRENHNANQYLIEIEDDGRGIDDDIKDRIFEPFVTTKANGTGLGLAIAYRIITSFGGNIFVDRSSIGGARFTIVF